ncbi:MAG: DUF932 domain-containing protein, partial [Candidatus Margulisiibacteriota bacterium]
MTTATARMQAKLKHDNENLLTASEAIIKFGLNWEVNAERIYGSDGKELVDYKAVRRSDTQSVFQVAKNRYLPVQNRQAFSLGDEITKTGIGKYVDGGFYGNGEVVFLTMKLPYDFEVLKGDEIKTYLKIVTSHDGSIPVMIYPETWQQICKNGAHAWRRDYARTVSVRHTTNAEARFLFKAQEVLQFEIEYFKKFAEACRELARKQMKNFEIDSFLSKLFNSSTDELSTRAKNQIERIKELNETGKHTAIIGSRGTAWGLYSAITEYVTHEITVKGEESEKARNREFSADFGTGLRLREKAF